MWTLLSLLTAMHLNAALLSAAATSLRSFMIWLTLLYHFSVLVKRYIFDIISSFAVHRSPSRSSGLDRSESMLYGGSMSQLNGGGNVYLPDYSVRQLTHLQLIKVKPETHMVSESVLFIWKDDMLYNAHVLWLEWRGRRYNHDWKKFITFINFLLRLNMRIHAGFFLLHLIWGFRWRTIIGTKPETELHNGIIL